MNTRRLTMAQAIVQFLKAQYVARDGEEQTFFAGMFGIFGHGNVAGLGQALNQYRDEFRFYQTRNEQAMVHTAIAYTKLKNRLRTFVCTTSIGPGATNMVTGAATATINRLPVLLLPGDIFARRNVAPVLQQLEHEGSQDISVNDCFKPVSRYWDRLNRPDQAITALPEAMRILTSPAETGAVTLGVPQDTQAEAFDYPEEMFEKRVWTIARPRADRYQLASAITAIKASKRPMIIAGGGVIYSAATESLTQLVEATGIPVGETMSGKGSLRYDALGALGAIGVTGTPAANVMAREADLVINIGTRLSDFTTASKTAFQDPEVSFLSINVSAFDAAKHSALSLVADAKVTIEELIEGLADYRVDDAYATRVKQLQSEWDAEVDRIYNLNHRPILSQGEVIGAVNDASNDRDVMVCAAGSLPGDLHKLWRTRDPKQYHLEYGYSCMGYEIAGGLGAKMADSSREVYVMVGDGSYLMLAQEIMTSIQEDVKLTIVLLDNHGHASIGGLSGSVGAEEFGTKFQMRNAESGQLDGGYLPTDLAANAESLGAVVLRPEGKEGLVNALEEAKGNDRTTVIFVEVDREVRVGGYDAWWDCPVAEVSTDPEVQRIRTQYEQDLKKERYL
ncbi:MAG: 3D-(3,5/4)-trihydroxycyclohexane-1,2-dione acylhydrolase (decyclizing) [Gemmatimonadetes bacterium]|jgi:3D-(3,5/4)-trihydroxycyclohexane-1,2-dione acylhydrolase (decyclizing)|nr:3D-(3,5/4)-trihydroxycyclohexane-1,2-dione acylhydrolase (decyclizing) [Gemmatimonadota bacterium]HCK11986.1 3D-(3,5/4)-trihydroxycyclohexane-1,2-dione acylhydrolase (decyclizing) [Candidatus Latescibacterota bacterium]